MQKEIVTKQPIKLKAGEPHEIFFTEPFRIIDSMSTILGHGVNGALEVRLLNANGREVKQDFKMLAIHNTVIAFDKNFKAGMEDLAYAEFYSISFTSNVDLNGYFSYGVNYPADFINIHRQRN